MTLQPPRRKWCKAPNCNNPAVAISMPGKYFELDYCEIHWKEKGNPKNYV